MRTCITIESHAVNPRAVLKAFSRSSIGRLWIGSLSALLMRLRFVFVAFMFILFYFALRVFGLVK